MQVPPAGRKLVSASMRKRFAKRPQDLLPGEYLVWPNGKFVMDGRGRLYRPIPTDADLDPGSVYTGEVHEGCGPP